MNLVGIFQNLGFNCQVVEFWVSFVDEIVIDAEMDLEWLHKLSLMPPSLTCSALDPLQSGFVP